MREMGRRIAAHATALVIVAACLTVLTACVDRAELEQVQREAQRSHGVAERQQAVIAVEVVRLNYGRIYGARGFGSVAAPTVAEQLVRMMNSAEGPKRTFTYVADHVTGPWQVVIKAEGDTLHVAAYGSTVSQPLEQISFGTRR